MVPSKRVFVGARWSLGLAGAFLAGVILLAGARSCAAQVDTLAATYRVEVAVLLAEPLVAELDEVSRSAIRVNREAMRCLLGVVRGGVAYIDVAFAPLVIEADSVHTVTRACPLATVAEWHTHLPIPGEPTAAGCFLSAVDVAGAVAPRPQPVVLIVQSARTRCWWTHQQVLDHVARRGVVALPPIRGQLR